MSDSSAADVDSGFRTQVRVLWHHARLIAVITAVTGAFAVVWTLLRPITYESSATVSVYAARLAEGFLRLPAESFLPLMTNQVVMADAASKLTMPLRAVQGAVTVRVVQESNLIRVVARSQDADSAARMANVVAQVGVEAANRMTRSDIDVVDAELKTMVDAAAVRLKEAEQSFQEYRKSAQLEAVEREVDILLAQRADLMAVSVDLEAERARLARVEEEASRQQPLTSLRQSVIEDPVLAEAVRGSSSPARDPMTIEMRREVPNELSARLGEDAAVARAEVAALERRKASLLKAAGAAGNDLTRLDELYTRESRLQRLEVELKLAQKAYEDVSAKSQGARLAALARTPQLRVVDPALAPDLPLGRFLARNVLLGLTVGAMLACAVVMIRDILRST